MRPTERRAKVLVVDDEASILSSISDLLEFEFDVTTTTDPRQGLNELVNDELSVIVCDQRMPTMDGSEFLRLAREKSSATRVLLTGFADIEAIARVVNGGKISAYLTKPWDPAALRSSIRSAAKEHDLSNALSHERDLLRTLVDNIPDCVYVQDASQRYTLVNWAFAKLAGLGDPEDAIGKTELECFPGKVGNLASAAGRKILETGTPMISQCDEWDRGDKGIRWYSTTRVPIRSPIDGRIDSLVGISIDITKQKEIETYLTKAKQSAEEAVRAKEQFLARISHEIRTPLNSILGMADLLSASDLTAQQRKYVKVLQTNNEMLLRMMSDLIDLSRSDLNELRLAAVEFDPRHAVRDVIETFERAAAAKGIKLTRQIGETVPVGLIGDCGRLKQILNNVVTNALKFTDEGEVRIKLVASPANDAMVLLEFAVEDTGIGIPADKLEDIFEPFHQAQEFITGKYDGSGLGLTISRQLVQQMGGSIWVESSLGSGSIFRFTVRLRNAGQSPVTVAPEPRPTRRGFVDLKILLAEDSEDNVFLVQAYLEGLSLEVASNGHEAVKKFVVGNYDVVLMDLQMPEMDGLQATRVIREWEKSNNRQTIPILAYTAHSDGEEESLRAGCNGHISKPASQQTLLSMIAKHTNAGA